MRKHILVLSIITAAIQLSCLEPSQNMRRDPFALALERINLEREDLTFDYGDMSNYGGDKFSVPLFYTLHSDFFKLEPYAQSFKQSLKRAPDQMHTLIAFGSQRINEGVRRGLISDPINDILPLLEASDPLYDAIDKLHKVTGKPLAARDSASISNESQRLPSELRKAAAAVIYASIDSIGYHDRAFLEARKAFYVSEMFGLAQRLLASEDDITDFRLERFAELVDFKYLYAFGQDLARAVTFVSDSLEGKTFEGRYSFYWESPLGKIIISDNTDNTYSEGAYLLILDAGGNDRYIGGAANQSIDNWISVLIDLDGDDLYNSENENNASFGAGVFGYAMLVDNNGSDSYIGQSITGGVGMFGVGVLLDKAGADIYDGYVCAQGAGQFGIGILSDLEGDDSYHAYQLAQGYGFTKGFGLLLDMSGNDDYYADTLDIAFPASQTKDYNSNLAQGVGFGKRADYIDGHSWGGGVGMLVDASGDDTYSAGLFAQGCAYWYAVGLLLDDAGDDRYNGVWYVQGSGAHFGMGALIDSSGNDYYYATMNMAQGAGHDFTLGALVDCSGNDIYEAPNLSLGGGNANGIGIFWDKSGDDSYSVSQPTTLGRSNVASRGGLRDYILCLGLFLDTGGNDTYPRKNAFDFAGDNKLWIQHGLNKEIPLEVEKGVGFDC